MDYIIRPAQKEDMAQVLRLIKQLAKYEQEPDAVVVTVEDLVENGFGKQPLFNCYLLEIEEQIRGIALFYFRYSTWKGKTVHLEDIIVEEDYRGRGFGKALFQRTVRFAEQHGVKRMEWVVIDWNQSAIDFYEKAGATVYKKWNTVQFDEPDYLAFLNR